MGQTKAKKLDKTENTSEVQEKVEQKSSKSAKVRGKQYIENKQKIDRSKLYSLSDAIKLVKEINVAKFNATMEMHLLIKKVGTNVNVSLPNSTGSTKKIEVADEKTLKNLEDGKLDFDILLATADFMPKLVKYARLLGPKGLMPNPKNGTLLKSLDDAKNFSTDKINIKTEKKAPVIHTTFGKVEMKDEELIENASTIIMAVGPKQILRAYISSSMSPSVKVLVE